ncbi:MAG TPA: RNA polymerase sigma factor SigZ [Mucilaginibacter sp.]|jgi:RNA polymerase sigma-70 factor (ECF subfamily)
MNEATNAIWNHFDEELRQFICKKVNHQDDCHDILQNVYIKVLNNIDRIQQANNIGSYVFRIANNEVMNHYRASVKYERVELLEIEPEQADIKEQALQLADCCLRPMIESLPPIYRDALIMTELEGLSQKALAEKLGISISGAKSRVQRAREKLKAEILNCCQYEFDKYGNIISCCKNKIQKKGNGC